ncbi:hypothetical protein FB451DRAFT_1453193 [Mycena latifolia]|nr:hypothetical protein FB451DRAFT_1453193 [Mycena latifolia]
MSNTPRGYQPMPWYLRTPRRHPSLTVSRSLKQIRAAIPARCFVRSTGLSLLYLVRDVVLAATFWAVATAIDPLFLNLRKNTACPPIVLTCLLWLAWCVYWWFQGLVFTGILVIGHECGHGAFSTSRTLNDTIGFITHSLLWTPYFSWKISHHRHHISHASMERDEVYVPKTRSDLVIPPPGVRIDYGEIFGDTPLFTLFMLVRQQLLAFPAYLLFNSSGQKNYPKWTNHFSREFLISIWRNSANPVNRLQVIPHFRTKEWNFQRGAAATVDRSFLGWQGNVFLHSVARYHIIHHFSPKIPFYHGAEATEALKAFIGEYYAFSDKPAFQALWDNYNACQFVEDDGDILFYRDKKGEALLRPATEGQP